MTKIIKYLFLLSTTFCIKAVAQDTLTIVGTIDSSLNNKTIIIQIMYSFQNEYGRPKLADTSLITDGKFHFKLPVKTVELYSITLIDKKNEDDIAKGIIAQKPMASFYLAPKLTRIIFTDTLLKNYKVIGNDADNQSKMLSQLTSGAKFAPHEIVTNLLEWLGKNKNSLMSATALQLLVKKIPDEQLIKLYEELPDSLKTNSNAQEIAYYIDNLTVGKKAPSFTQGNHKGEMLSLSDFRGKFVLIEFWASWCVPCRYETPYLKQAFNIYSNKNFSILSVSLDHNKSLWLAAIKKDKLAWAHVSDLKGWGNEVSRYKYKIAAVPANFLVGPDGKIIAKNLQGNQLLAKLKELKLN